MDNFAPADEPIQVPEILIHTTQSQFSHVWDLTFEDLRFMIKSRASIISTRICTAAGDVWCLKYMVQKGLFSVRLCLVSSKKNRIKATYEMSIIEGDTHKVCTSHSDTNIFLPNTVHDDDELHGFVRLVSTDKLFKNEVMARTGQFAVLCEVMSEVDTSDVPKSCNDLPFDIPDCHIVEDMKGLFETRAFGDVNIIIGDKQVRAHKAILTMRSKFFSAMFDRERADKVESQITMFNVDPEVFEEVLRFIYTGEVKKMATLTKELLAASEKYNLDRLKVMCEEELRSYLAVENAAEMLILADLYNAQKLKSRVAEFILENLSQVFETQNFQAMTKSHPILMREILRASVTNQEFIRCGSSGSSSAV